MSTYNRDTIAPNPLYPERAPHTYDTVIGPNTPRREGPRQAEENVASEPAFSSSFVGGVQTDLAREYAFETKIAPNARGRLASGQEIPAWNAVTRADLGAFWQGTDGSEQSVTAKSYPFAQRPGSNPKPLTNLAALRAGERPGNVYQTTIAPSTGGRNRRNEADVTEL